MLLKIQKVVNIIFYELDLHQISMSFLMQKHSQFKGACSDPQVHPTTFYIEILIPEIETLYLEDSMCEVSCAKSVFILYFRRRTLLENRVEFSICPILGFCVSLIYLFIYLS